VDLMRVKVTPAQLDSEISARVPKRRPPSEGSQAPSRGRRAPPEPG
jgi:hypothetical protein